MAEMADTGACACCGSPGVNVHEVVGPVATWTTWRCGACGYELQEHVVTRDELHVTTP